MAGKTGPLSAGNWHRVADEVLGWRDRHREPGETVASRAEWVAERESLHRQTLRRVVAARSFVLGIEGEDFKLGKALRSQPYTAIEPLAKWYRYDRAAATAEAKKLVAGERTVRSIIAAENSARVKTDRAPSPREWVAAVVEAVVDKTPGYRVAEADDWRASSIDAVLEPVDGEGHLVMVLVVGPYSDQALYERKRLDTLLIAAGIASLRHQVLIVLPKGISIKKYKIWIKRSGIFGIFMRSMDC